MDLAGRVRALYATHNAAKLNDVPALLAKYAGKEDKLLRALVKKYGPEPEVSAAVPPTPTISVAEPTSPAASPRGRRVAAAPSRRKDAQCWRSLSRLTAMS